jgi:hypothetical protein
MDIAHTLLIGKKPLSQHGDSHKLRRYFSKEHNIFPEYSKLGFQTMRAGKHMLESKKTIRYCSTKLCGGPAIPEKPKPLATMETNRPRIAKTAKLKTCRTDHIPVKRPVTTSELDRPESRYRKETLYNLQEAGLEGMKASEEIHSWEREPEGIRAVTVWNNWTQI